LESTELPDHLTRVLKLLDRMQADEAAVFAEKCVAPAVEKMLAGLSRCGNPYEILLKLVAVILDETFGLQKETEHGHFADPHRS
jgi:nitrate reductase assembly molybdenum cofactor insertion protein NarJ